jgi:hypothetical protein
MKSIFVTALILCSISVFGQTAVEGNSLKKQVDKGTLVNTNTGSANPVLISTKRDAEPASGLLTISNATDKTTAPQGIKKEEPKR